MQILSTSLTRCVEPARVLRRYAAACAMVCATTACTSTPSIAPTNQSEQLGSSCALPDSQSLASVVKVYAENGEHSSGVVIASDRVVTVSHGLPAGERVFVSIDEQLKVATVLARHASEDLALLEVRTGATPVMPLGQGVPAENDLVWAVGFPLGMDQRTSLGLFQGGSASLVYSSAHINSGASGGALLHCEAGSEGHAAPRYTLAGVLKGFLAQPTAQAVVNTGDSVAVSTQRIRELLEQASPQIAQNR